MAKEVKTKVVKKCSICHGTGQVTCSKCGGKGERKCPHCDGTGHACPVCSRGYVKKKRLVNCSHCYGKGYTIDQIGEKYRCYDCGGRGQIEETYKEICPNCHGDYTKSNHVCDRCGGKKKISCARHETCSYCRGRGSWYEDKISEKNSRVFLALGMIGGLFGLHYAYIRRWVLCAMQLTLFLVLIALVFGSGMIAETVGIDSSVLSMVKWCVYAATLILWLMGIAVVKRDNQGGELKDEFKEGLFWLFFLLFGFTGAYLAYGKSKLLVFHAGFLIFLSLPAVSWGWGDYFIMAIQNILLRGTVLACIEFLVLEFFSSGDFKRNGN